MSCHAPWLGSAPKRNEIIENKRIISSSIKKQEAEAAQAILKKSKSRKVPVTKAIFKNARRIKDIMSIVISDDEEQERDDHHMNNIGGRNINRQVRTRI